MREAALMGLRVLLLLFAQPAAALHIPASLRRHLQHKLASALAGGAAPCAAAEQTLQDDTASSLVDALVEETPEQADAAAWAQTSGTKLARLISANSTAGKELSSGRLMVVDALALADARHRRSTDMFQAVQVHHAALRQAVRTSTPGAASASSAWESATADGEALQRYGEAAVDVGRRRWARLGIEWCTATAHEHYHGGGATRRARKRAARAHYRATGEALPAEVAQRIERELAAASQVRKSQPIRLLDVGSCGFLFGEADGFLCTALDLCPQDPRTFECDFLSLQVGPRGEERGSYASGAGGTLAADASAGRLESLPAASFDVVVFSLVFSYLPLAEQRAAMVAQARKLLTRPASPFAGLLLLVDTHSSMGSRSGRGKSAVQDEWVRTIESLGFKLLTRQTLERSHALAFVAAPLRHRGEGSGEEELEEEDDNEEQDDDFELAAELATRLAAGARLRTRGEVEREEARAAALNNGPGPSFGDELLMNERGQGEGERQHSAAERLTRWSAAAAFAGEHTADVAQGAAVPLARYCASGAIFSALTSRTQANNAARRGELRLNGQEANGASRVRSGDVLSLQTPPPPPVSPPSLRRLERFVDTLTLTAVRPEPGGGPEPGSGRLQVLHEDAEVAVVFKPPGVHSAPWAGTRKRWGTLTLSDALPLLLSPPPADRAAAAPLAAPLPAHRLDARVGGVLVCAKSRRALAGLSALFKERRVHKVYRAIVVGEVDLSLLAARDSTSHPRLAKSRGARGQGSASEAEGDGAQSVSIGELACTAIEHAGDAGEVSPAGEVVSVLRVEEAFEDGRESITEVRVLQITPCSVHGALTTLDLRPLTGRRHQLRVACALGLGAPILGDDLYHSRANTARAASNLPPLPPVRRKAGLFLQALEVTLPHPITGDTLSVRAGEMARFGKLRAKAASGAGFTDEEWEVWRA